MTFFLYIHLEDQWLSRSLFVLKRQLFVCFEDLKQFSTLFESSAPPSYFFLDSSCFIVDISDMVSYPRSIHTIQMYHFFYSFLMKNNV